VLLQYDHRHTRSSEQVTSHHPSRPPTYDHAACLQRFNHGLHGYHRLGISRLLFCICVIRAIRGQNDEE
jgi:hypothetical protein